MSYKSYRSYKQSLAAEGGKISQFIAKFNFPEPRWDNLPVGFPNLSKEGLTIQEGHLLDAIKLAWINSNNLGRKYYLQKTVQNALLVISILVIGTLTIRVLKNLKNSYTMNVYAAREIVSGVVQSTMSAVLRMKN